MKAKIGLREGRGNPFERKRSCEPQQYQQYFCSV
jgi:hypothetical protein